MNYNGEWSWSVFWLSGIIGFIFGFLFVFFTFILVYDWETLIVFSIMTGVIFFILAGFFGDKFWNYWRDRFNI